MHNLHRMILAFMLLMAIVTILMMTRRSQAATLDGKEQAACATTAHTHTVQIANLPQWNRVLQRNRSERFAMTPAQFDTRRMA